MHWTMEVYSVILVVSMLATGGQAGFSCKNQNGSPVDWFVVYKLPKIYETEYPYISAGVGYMYLDAKTPTWSISAVSINATSGNAIAYTLTQIYDNKDSDNIVYGLYNDETPPKKVTYDHGHTKGDFAFGKSGGFWLVHSVPRFPPFANESYSYPPSGESYGQTFLCLTLDYKYLDKIGEQFMYTWPQFYSTHLPTAFVQDNPNIVKTFNKEHYGTGHKTFNIAELATRDMVFSSLAKTRDFEADLYDALVAPHFQSALQVETWLNSRGRLPSCCSCQYHVMNIVYIAGKGLLSSIKFSESKDHSKWAITDVNETVCIGDINRAKSQMERPGGTVCFKHPSVWKSFHDLVNQTQPCTD